MLNSLDLEFIQINRISGYIPDFTQSVDLLRQLSVRKCSLSGTLPEIPAQDLVYDLVFDQNEISGTLNFAVSQLGFLRATANKLSGTVAPGTNIQYSILRNLFRECHYLRLHLIRAVQVSDNQVSGTLSVYGQRTRNMFMAANAFSGEIPAGAVG